MFERIEIEAVRLEHRQALDLANQQAQHLPAHRSGWPRILVAARRWVLQGRRTSTAEVVRPIGQLPVARREVARPPLG